MGHRSRQGAVNGRRGSVPNGIRFFPCILGAKPLLPQLYSVWSIDVEQPNRRPPRWRQTKNFTCFEQEMLRPVVRPRIEQRHSQACVGVNTRQIGPLEGIASITGQGQILRVVVTGVLLGKNVFDVKRDERRRFLRNPTVFATVAGATPHQLTTGCVRFSPNGAGGTDGLLLEESRSHPPIPRNPCIPRPPQASAYLRSLCTAVRRCAVRAPGRRANS